MPAHIAGRSTDAVRESATKVPYSQLVNSYPYSSNNATAILMMCAVACTPELVNDVLQMKQRLIAV